MRVLTDFRKWNACIKRKLFLLPIIGETIQKLEKFKSAAALDFFQLLYSIPIDEVSQKFCSTVLPLVKYDYKCLSVAITCAPDIFRSIMMDLLDDIGHVLVCIDNTFNPEEEDQTSSRVA